MKNYQLSKLDGQRPCDPFFDLFWGTPFDAAESKRTARLLETDILEEKDSYVLTINVPGIKKEEIAVDYDDGYLTVAVKQMVENKDDEHYLRKERHVYNAERSFYFGDIDEKGISASLENGVLSISVPKETKKQETKHSIAIN